MSALMSDTLSGDISPQVAGSVCAAGRNLLRIVEMQYRYGSPVLLDSQKNLVLTSSSL